MTIHPFRTAVFLAGLSLGATNAAEAAVLALYEFQAGSVNSSDVDTSTLASAFTGSGLSDFNQGNAFSFLDSDIESKDYLSFTLTPQTGAHLELTALSFSAYRLGAGTTTGTVQVRTSLDGFNSALNLFNTSTFTASTTQTLTAPPAAGFFVDVSNSSFDSIGDAGVEFRFYFTGSAGGPPNRRNVIDDILVTGTGTPLATAVPVPAPLLLLGSALGMLGWRRRTRG